MRRYAIVLLVTLLIAGLLPGTFGCGRRIVEAFPEAGSGARVELLIVSHPSLAEPATRLAEFKARSGSDVALMMTDAIDRAYGGRDLAMRIRNCIKDYHSRKHARYVLIAGAPDLVPTRYVFCPYAQDMSPEDIELIRKENDPRQNEEHYVATDLYYANLVDDWDINRNGTYGEVGSITGLKRDEGGFSSQVYVGRIPARSAGDLEEVVRKIIGYQPDGSRNALFVAATKDVADFIDGERFSDYLVSTMGSAWSPTVVAEGQTGFGGGQVLRLLNSGDFQVVTAVTHGAPFGLSIRSLEVSPFFSKALQSGQFEGWGLALFEYIEKQFKSRFAGDPNPPFLDDDMVKGLTNANPFLFLGFGCCIAYFDYSPHYSFLERLVIQRNGAIAAFGMSTWVYVEKGLYESSVGREGGVHFELGAIVLENVCKKGLALGPAIYDAIGEYAKKHPKLMGKTDHRRAAYGITLVGDPTLKLSDGR